MTVIACSTGPPRPAEIDTRHDTCLHCRMTVSDVALAAQIVAPQEEPKFFDDLGCLQSYLTTNRALPRGSIVFVADHRTRTWVPAAQATYVRSEAVATPMASHMMAFADVASRDEDPASAGGTPVTAAEFFGGLLPRQEP